MPDTLFSSTSNISNDHDEKSWYKNNCMITIIMPVFNVYQYLNDAVMSLLESTIQDFHLICIDDGSNDGSGEMLDLWAKKEKRITVFHQENKGGGSARNAGLPYLQGRYTYFMDADDWIEPALFEYTIHDLEKTGADVIAFNARVIDRNGNSHIEKRFTDVIADSPLMKTPFIRHAEPWSKVWRTSHLLENRFVWTDGTVSNNDNYFNWQGMIKARLALATSEHFYNYRIREGSLQRSHDQKHFGWAKINNDIKSFLKESGYWDQYRTLYFKMKCNIGYYYKYQCLNKNLSREFSKRMAVTFCSDEITMLGEHLLSSDCQEYYESIIDAYCKE